MYKSLKLEIESGNIIKMFAKQVVKGILPELGQFIGKKIFTVDGSRAKIFNLDFSAYKPAELKDTYISVQYCYMLSAHGQVDIKISLCFSGGSYDVKPVTAFTKYVDRQISVGRSEDGQILDDVYDLKHIVEAYELDEIIDLDEELAKIKAYKKLQEIADKAKTKIKVSGNFYEYI